MKAIKYVLALILVDGSTIDALPGEPFTLATYIDSEGDLTESELTEEMATRVQTVDTGIGSL